MEKNTLTSFPCSVLSTRVIATQKLLLHLSSKYSKVSHDIPCDASLPALTITVPLLNLATHNANWPRFAQMMCQRFGYEKITAMVTGAEAVDTACKVARKWASRNRGIAPQDTVIISVAGNYHGLTSGVWTLMTPSAARSGRTITFDKLPCGC